MAGVTYGGAQVGSGASQAYAPNPVGLDGPTQPMALIDEATARVQQTTERLHAMTDVVRNFCDFTLGSQPSSGAVNGGKLQGSGGRAATLRETLDNLQVSLLTLESEISRIHAI